MSSLSTSAPSVSVNRALALVFLTLFIDMLGIGLLIPVITPLLLRNPTLFAEGTTPETRTLTYGLLQTAFSLATFLSAPLLGLWSDQIGRRKGLIYSIAAGVLGYVVFLIGIKLASLPLLFVGRIIPGLAAGNLTMAFAAIADVSDNTNRAKNFALIGMAFGLAMVLGPPAGAWLSSSHALSWLDETTPFYVGTFLAVLNLVLMFFFFQETLKSPRTVTLNLLQAAKNVGTAFTHPRLRGLFLVSLLASFGFNAFTGFLQLYLIRHYDIDNAFFGQLMAFVGVCLIATQGFLFRFLLKFYPASKLGVLAMFLLGPAVWATLLTAVVAQQYWVVPFIAIGQGISSPSLAATISGRADPRMQGEILGLNNSMLALGLTLTLLVGGFTASWNPAAPLVTAGASILLAAIVFARESWNEPLHPSPAAVPSPTQDA